MLKTLAAISLFTVILASAGFLISNRKVDFPGNSTLHLPAITGKTQPTKPHVPALSEQGVELATSLVLDDMKDSIRGAESLLSRDEVLHLSGIDVETRAEQYDSDYDANEVAADEKYEGKRILLIGVIESINKDFKGDAYLILRANNPLLGVQAELNESGKAGASALVRGANVSLVCDSGTRIIGSAVARNCEQFSQHLEEIRHSIQSAIEKQLQKPYLKPTNLERALQMLYIFGTQLPPDSPCFTGGDAACQASMTSIMGDKAKMESLVEQIKRTFPTAEPSISPPKDVAQLMAQEDDLNDKCRDGSGDDDGTIAVCRARDVLYEKIKAKNWCWGHDGQIGADSTWGPCDHSESAQPLKLPTHATP